MICHGKTETSANTFLLTDCQGLQSYFESGGGGGLTSDSKWGVGGELKTLFLSIIETSPRKALIASSLQELEACLSLYIFNYQCAPSAVGSCQH